MSKRIVLMMTLLLNVAVMLGRTVPDVLIKEK